MDSDKKEDRRTTWAEMMSIVNNILEEAVETEGKELPVCWKCSTTLYEGSTGEDNTCWLCGAKQYDD